MDQMQYRRQATDRDSGHGRDLVRFVAQIGVPAAVVDALTMTHGAAPLSIFGIPFCDWAPIACSIWMVLVLHCGPFAITERL